MKLVKQELVSLTPPAVPCWVVLETRVAVPTELHERIGLRSYRNAEVLPVLALALVDDTWENDAGEGEPGEREVTRTIYPVSERGMWDGSDDPRGLPTYCDTSSWSLFTDRAEAQADVDDARRTGLAIQAEARRLTASEDSR